MMKKLIFFSFLFFIIFSLSAQKYTISGYVEDASNGEKLFSANVFDANTYSGGISNTYGFYSLTLSAGEVKLTASFVGFSTQQFVFDLKKDTVINIYLTPNQEIEEVIVTESRIDNGVQSTQMSQMELPMKMLKTLPVLLGEVDVMKGVQLMPGVQSGSEGSSGVYVRGGGPDQNLILLDGVPVYNVNHLFGFFSVFNADAIQNVTLIKGGFPARYGGRLSSVIDIRMKEGDNKEFHGTGSVGIISSKLALEGPINEKTSFIVSGRRTYIDILAQPFIKMYAAAEDLDNFGTGYYFYDLNSKINHKFSDKSRLYLSAYLGNDKAYSKYRDEYNSEVYEENAKLRWGNITTALRWNYLINPKLFSNTTLTYSRYKFLVGMDGYQKTGEPVTEQTSSFEYNSGIEDITAKIDFDYFPTPNHAIKFGISNIYHQFKPGVQAYKVTTNTSEIDDINVTFGNKNIPANEVSAYFEDDFILGRKFKFNAGIHLSMFNVRGKSYYSFQPRLSGRYLITDKLSIKAGVSKMSQYIHLLTSSSIGLPTDLWLPVTDSIEPQLSWQYAIGTMYSINESFDFSIECFYKDMQNLIGYKEGASFFDVESDWEDKVEIGKGWSYGMEVLLQKNNGKTTGWIGYTLAWAWREFDNISFGEKFPYTYDRRHDVSLVISHKFSDRWDMGLTWVYGTGNAITLAKERYYSPSGYGYYNIVNHYETRNNYRMPAYHRLDIGVNLHKVKRWGTATWSFGLYNAYNSQNAFDFNIESNYEKETNEVVQYSLFPIIPSVSYSFSF